MLFIINYVMFILLFLRVLGSHNFSDIILLDMAILCLFCNENFRTQKSQGL